MPGILGLFSPWSLIDEFAYDAAAAPMGFGDNPPCAGFELLFFLYRHDDADPTRGMWFGFWGTIDLPAILVSVGADLLFPHLPDRFSDWMDIVPLIVVGTLQWYFIGALITRWTHRREALSQNREL